MNDQHRSPGPHGRLPHSVGVALDKLFQLALLITGNLKAAEAALASCMDGVDVSDMPATDACAVLENAVVMEGLRRAHSASGEPDQAAGSMLLAGLSSLLHLDAAPRCSFVLRFLVGYSITRSARLLGVTEARFRKLLQTAVCGLQFASARATPYGNTN